MADARSHPRHARHLFRGERGPIVAASDWFEFNTDTLRPFPPAGAVARTAASVNAQAVASPPPDQPNRQRGQPVTPQWPDDPDSESEVMRDARRRVVQRGKRLARRWASGVSGPAPPWASTLTPGDRAALAVQQRRRVDSARVNTTEGFYAGEGDVAGGGQCAREVLRSMSPTVRVQVGGGGGADGGTISDALDVGAPFAASSTVRADEVLSSRHPAAASGEPRGQRAPSETPSSDRPVLTRRRMAGGRPTAGKRRKM